MVDEVRNLYENGKGVMKMLRKLYSNWKRLKNTRHRETKGLVMKRRKFVNNLTKTFWAVAPKCERELEKSSDTSKIEDWNFLQRMETTREGRIGSIDKKFQDKQARRRYEARLLQKQNSSTLDVNSTTGTLPDFEDDPDVEEVSCSHEDPDFILPESSEHKCVKLREVVLTGEVCLIADKAKLSHRNTAQLLGAALKQQGKEIDNVTLSVMSVKRKTDHTQSIMKNSAQSIMKNQVDDLHETDGRHYNLHWDEKVLKGLNHASKSEKRVAILLVGNEREMLLGIPSIENGTAETITSEIIRMIKEKKIPLHKIAGLVFDTTCINYGLHGGVVKRLQDAVGKPLLQLACRHHISESWGGAACNIIYGSTVSPGESRFKALANKWNELNLVDYRLLNISDRYLKAKIREVLGFLNTFLTSDTVIRDDYRQLAELSFLLLGGNGRVINMHAPGASHHARWMSSTTNWDLFFKRKY